MRITGELKGVSTIILILLIFISFILGAFVSYMWVMGSFYNMPTDRDILVVENVVFSPKNFSHFNVTVLNPSNSASDINITAFRLAIDGKNQTYEINTTDYPSPLAFTLKRGTRQTFRCIRNWSNFTGETVKIDPIAEAVSTMSKTYAVPKVQLRITPVFNATNSVQNFTIIVNSGESTQNLTITQFLMYGQVLNVTLPEGGFVMSPNRTEPFTVYHNWEDQRGINTLLIVKTSEGYENTYFTDKLPGAAIYIESIAFNYSDTTYFDLTIVNAEDSTALTTLSMVNLTLPNNTTSSLNTSPPLSITPPMGPNTSRTFRCFWDWSSASLRNLTASVKVYTLQGNTIPAKTVNTPSEVIWNITDTQFNMDDTEHFTVNITNLPCSLRDINITSIQLNNQTTAMNPPFAVISNGSQTAFTCTFNWTALKGLNSTLVVTTRDGTNLSMNVTIPAVKLEILGDQFIFGDIDDIYEQALNITIPPNMTVPRPPYVNITISNSAGSVLNVTITRIVIEVNYTQFEIDNSLTYPRLGESGYLLRTNSTISIICIWDYTPLNLLEVKVTVYTAEGYKASKTWYQSPP